EVVLPKATSVKELKPAHVVTISSKEILLDKDVVATFEEVRINEDWSIENLKVKLQESLEKSKIEQDTKLQNRIRDVVEAARGGTEEDPNAWRKVTIQADKGVDFLTVKKVLYTVTEAGAGEINFAVTKLPQESTSN
ncbi:adventurous gliding motility protein S, partial [Listeria monocytogenes]|uniref:ExbD/TolR family protein n=1 Tax=Listeria monocytogenes TaxID=1639 RepID=UPI000F823175